MQYRCAETGLEAKFSLRLTVAMALAGRDTSRIGVYEDAMTCEAELVRLRDAATIAFEDSFSEAKAQVLVTAHDGLQWAAEHDAGVADADLARQGSKLAAKFDALVEPVLGRSTTSALRERLGRLRRKHDCG